MKDLLNQWIAYNQQMNQRFLDLASALTADQVTADHGYGRSSIITTLYHLVTVETIWRQLTHDGKISTPFPQADALHTISQIQLYYDEEATLLALQIAAYSDHELNEVLTVTDWRGRQHQLQRAQMVSHLLNHSMQHRSEIAVWLTSYGQSPGDVDLIFFFMSLNK